ncbi:MAG: FAD-binding and (Fe-S)-binding domain-containing protein [Coriobacteriia bacterium]|nr:FAD-binding and (Fe-S)-binding domain-containing protein [Coriobacteriia bacterium]
MAVSERIETTLSEIVGVKRVSTDRVERKLYSADIGVMPVLVAPFLPNGLAGAVVRPHSEDEVVAVVKLAAREGLKLVPRGASTSGYGGVLPMKGAVVVDVSGMAAVLDIDNDARTARVQGGIIWEPLQKALNKAGLDVRLYPSSTPSSTVAGWLAQGGSGFGSYEYGMFKDSVLSARVILPTGEAREFSGTELATLVADAEGITGIITEVTIALRDLEPEVHRAIAFPDAASLGAALSELSRRAVPIWSITFLNPESVGMKKLLPHRHGHPYEEAHAKHAEPVLPEAYIAVIAYPESRRPAVDLPLEEIAAAHRGTDLGPEIAEHEWDQRFAPMRLKRIGPSIIPTEVIVPLSEMPAVLAEIDEKIKQPFVLEGMVGKGDYVVLLGFIPHDQRSFAFNAAFALSLSVIAIAKRHGGAAYSTGLYFRHEAGSVLGAERVATLAAYKKRVDPAGLMNPNKVLGSGVIDVIMGMAAALEPVIRPVANAMKPPAGDPMGTRDINGIPAEVAFYAYACAQCGYCVPTCEEYTGRGWMSHSPRGKYLYLREVVEGREKFDQHMVNTFLVCTTCEVCNGRCQLQLPVEHSWMTMRGKLIDEEKRMTFPPFEMMAASLRGERDIWAGKAEHRADWVPEDMKPKIADEGPLLYFAGCTASFVNTDVAEASVRLLTDAGYDISYMGEDEACCGIPMKVAGKWDLFEEIYVHNTTEARKRGAKTIVTSCPACGLVWKELYADIARKRGDEYEFEVKHYSELLADAMVAGDLTFDTEVNAKVAFHDSCHMGRAQGNYEPPRDMLKAMPGVELVEMEHNREDGLCCGSVLTLIGEKPVAPILGGVRLQEAIDVGADKLVALCPCCQVQLRDSAEKNGMDIEVDDLARFVAEAKGYTIPSSSDHSLYMWGYFDTFIDLMLPENMAGVMAEIFPQMMDAMPFGMKPMMGAMKHVPGGLVMMEKVLPLMFPAMAPGILSKVMPDMVEAVGRRVGDMPADMADLMPDLLPKTMDSLMPNYLPELIPHVTPLMIEYIRTEM